MSGEKGYNTFSLVRTEYKRVLVLYDLAAAFISRFQG
jgi:hypothetical protein